MDKSEILIMLLLFGFRDLFAWLIMILFETETIYTVVKLIRLVKLLLYNHV